MMLTAHPWQVARQFMGERLTVTPAPAAAESLGVSHTSLHALLGTVPASESQLEAALRHVLALQPLTTPRPALLDLLHELTVLPPDHRVVLLDQHLALANLYAAFHARLREGGARHPADLAVASVHPRPLLVYGFTTLTPAQLDVLDAAALDGSVIVLPRPNASFFAANEGASRLLAARGWTVDVQPVDQPTDPPGLALAARFAHGLQGAVPHVQASVARDRYAEVRQALNTVRAQCNEGALTSAALVVPDPREYAGAARAVAWEYGLPLHIKLKRQMKEARLGAWLGAVFQTLLGDWAFERVLTLLGHPLTGGLPVSVQRVAHQRRPSTRQAWVDLGLPRFLGDWAKDATLSDYVQQLLFHLEELNADALSDQDYAIGATLIDLLGEAPDEGFITLQTFAALALRALDEPLPELPGGPSAITMLTPGDVQGARYDHVFILGLSEGQLPAPLTDPPLLDLYERRRLRTNGVLVNTASDLVRARERDFWTALAAANVSVTLSYPAQVQHRPQRPSPYFQRLGLTPQPAAALQVLSLEERIAQDLYVAPAQTPEHLGAQRAVEAELSRYAGTPGAYTGLTSRPRDPTQHQFSATQLTRFGQCPYRWYAQHVLGLKETGSSDTELLPHERGELYHRVLELAVTAAGHSQNPRVAVQEHVEGAFNSAARELGLPRRAAWEHQAPEHLDRVRHAVRDDAFMPDGQTLVAAELKFDVQWHGLRVTGQIDRIDETAGGQLIITDYKSSSSKPKGAKDPAGKARLDVQLPLYLEVAAQLYPAATGVTGSYLSLTRREGRTLGKATLDPQALRDLTAELYSRMSVGHYPAEPDIDRHACTHCAYRTLCRRSDAPGGDDER